MGDVRVQTRGIPGPPGAGVTPAELAALLATTGGTMTGALILDLDSTGGLIVRKADDTNVLVVDTTNKEVELWNATKLRGFSDTGTTETFSIDSNTGAAQFDSTVTTTRVIGDTTIWTYVIDGGGSTITTGIKPDVVIPYAAKITRWDIYGDQSGSIVVDNWVDTYTNYPPLVGDTIVTSEKPTISAATKNQDTSLNSGNGWTLAQGSVMRHNVDSVTSLTRCTIAYWVTRL